MATWSREDLEGVDWIFLEAVGYFLMAAAPKLALACLEARAYAELIDNEGNFPRAADTRNLIRALDAALALAGVQP